MHSCSSIYSATEQRPTTLRRATGGWQRISFLETVGGTMPSHDLLLYFQSDVTLVRSWYIPGTHYSRTSEHWLKLQDKNAKVALKELREDAVAKGRPAEEGAVAFYRFRVFYIAVAEFFNLNNGQEWGVGHYLFKAKDVAR
ncbi:hypothetical protein HGRIS_002888 [Hohenbuehelia grisea]|uniref:Uncharacterized protein n=1 Tax=Hohenbuehelia grisea TaxID=104357 RepID=A0ABR3JN87_9AGAR